MISQKITYPLVSIMIPTYGQDQYIEQTVKTALSQDYPNVEIIISDDCSPDDTQKICVKLAKDDARIKYFRNSKNLGRVKNYNETLYNRVKGEYVLNLDGDDLLIDDHFISEAVFTIQKHNKINKENVLFYTACKAFILPTKKIKFVHKISQKLEITSGRDFILNLFSKYYFSHLTTLYRRDEALNSHFYDLNIISSDLDSLGRLAAKNEGVVIASKKVVGQWINTGFNESKKPNVLAQIENLVWIERVGAQLKKNVNTFTLVKWKFRMRYYYSSFILKSIIKSKSLNYTILEKIYKSRAVIPMICFSIIFPFNKIIDTWRN
tara:strand:+ start:6525 stop:7490 length:966 start_codon:yes stop_codon:yes gene_type:complete